MDLDQETIINIDGEIYEPILIVGHVTKLKQMIETQSLLIPNLV